MTDFIKENSDESHVAATALARMWAWYVIALLVVGLAYLGNVVLDAIL